LLAFNAANAAAGRTGGFFDLPSEAALDPKLALARIGGGKDEFIFDVQGHFVDPNGAWLRKLPTGSNPLSQMPKAGCGLAGEPIDPARIRLNYMCRILSELHGQRRCKISDDGATARTAQAGGAVTSQGVWRHADC